MYQEKQSKAKQSEQKSELTGMKRTGTPCCRYAKACTILYLYSTNDVCLSDAGKACVD